MKDTRFNELLNLYLDHRLTEADAAELEAEVMRCPDRRRAYNGYCRIQRACHVLFENECERAPQQSAALSRALQEVNRKIAGETTRGNRQVVWLGWSGALAAACVVVVSVTVAIQNVPGANESPIVAETQNAPSPVVQAAAPVLAAVQPAAPSAVIPASAVTSQVVDQQIWSRIAAQRWIDSEAESLMASRLVDDDRFVIHHTSDTGEMPSFQSRLSLGASARGELTSYQFQR